MNPHLALLLRLLAGIPLAWLATLAVTALAGQILALAMPRVEALLLATLPGFILLPALVLWAFGPVPARVAWRVPALLALGCGLPALALAALGGSAPVPAG